MNALYRQAVIQGVLGMAFFVALVFVPAGTWNYWRGWLFLGVFAASTTALTIYLAKHDSPLLERRLRAGPQHERKPAQRVIVTLVSIAFFAMVILPILDFRRGVSRVPAWVSVVGNAIIVLSYLGIFRVIRTNSWAASNVRVEAGQQVVDTGPYAIVRHPMYAAAIWLFVGIPLALGSWRWVGLVIPFIPVLLWRLLNEEKVLTRDLPGYTEYMRRVRYRLVPGVW